MITVVRLMLLGGGLTLVFFASPSDGMQLLIAGGASGLVVVATALAHAQRQRPWSDTVAWLGAAVFLGASGSPETMAQVLLATGGVAAMAVSLHVPALGVPLRQGFGPVATWTLVTVVASLLAWGPGLLARGQDIAVLDPFTSAGMAIRLLAAAAGVWLLVGLLSLRPARRQ